MYILYSFLFVFSFFAWGGITTLKIEQETQNTKQAIEQAIQEVSVDLMNKFIDPSHLKTKNKQIQKIISTRFNRYILSTQAMPFVKKGDLFITPVTIGFSKKNLKQILIQEDLFYSGTSHLRILPIILFADFINHKKYSWWAKYNQKTPLIKQQIINFYNQIQKTLISYGFFVINPELAGSAYFIPHNLSFNKIKKSDVFKLARYFKSHLVLVGSVKLKQSNSRFVLNLKVDLMIYNIDNGRVVAEIERFSKIIIKKEYEEQPYIDIFLKQNPDFVKGLGRQLKSIYESGQLASNILTITIQGDLNYKDYTYLIKQFKHKIKDIKSLQEHIIKSRSTTYIAHTKSSAKNIIKKINTTVFSGFNVLIVETRNNHIVLKVSSKNKHKNYGSKKKQ